MQRGAARRLAQAGQDAQGIGAERFRVLDQEDDLPLAVLGLAQAAHGLFRSVLGQEPGLGLSDLNQDALDCERGAEGVADADDTDSGTGSGNPLHRVVLPGSKQGGEPGWRAVVRLGAQEQSWFL